MFAVARKSKRIDSQAQEQIPAPRVESTSHEWRARVNAELDARGRGSRAALLRHLQERHPKLSSGLLSETLGPNERPGQKRWTQYKDEIDQYLWPALMPLTADTGELRHILDGLAPEGIEILRELKTMDRDAQRALAAFITSTRKPK